MTGIYKCFGGCGQSFLTVPAMNIHKGKSQCGSNSAPDLIGLGIVKRKLTRKESAKITKEVMSLGINDPDLRFRLAMVKIIELTGGVGNGN